ncbi:MAG: undecaprenyl-diphosphate phosphatase, partial [Oscillospiraceae bacterium]|nr:undecaprenyl-diphosphate phosphatase [Oscillospiraceae bacterium]
LVGMVFAGVVGYFAIGLMRRFVERCKLTYFSYYCWGVGALVLIISMFL